MLLAYLSPDTLLPMTSVAAAVVGCLAICGKGLFVIAARAVRLVVRTPARAVRRLVDPATTRIDPAPAWRSAAGRVARPVHAHAPAAAADGRQETAA